MTASSVTPPPTIHIFSDPDATADAVAQILATRLNEHAVARPYAIALSGGSTPQRLYQRLARDPYRHSLPWDRMAFFFGDERAVPPDHPDSNFRMAHEALLAHVPSAHFPMPADTGDAAGYEDLLRQKLDTNPAGVPVFDLILLGIGTDGHTASLFPGTAALAETKRAVVMNDVPQLATQRMTLTFPVLNAARQVWVLATGANKQPIVKGALHPQSDTPAWPIRQVHPPAGALVWWLDADAAATLVTPT